MPLFRILPLPKTSFFLFGARGTGKTTWLKGHFHDRPYFNLLNTQTYLELSLNLDFSPGFVVRPSEGPLGKAAGPKGPEA